MLPRRLILYTRPGCCLCDTAKFLLQRVLRSQEGLAARVKFQVLDISKDPGLEEKFADVLPVVQVDDRIVSELKINTARIREALLEV